MRIEALLAIATSACVAARSNTAGTEASGAPVGGSGAPLTVLAEGEGFELPLPEGWTAGAADRPDVIARADGPEGSGLSMRLLRWDGRVDSVIGGLDALRVDWASLGAYGGLEAIADGPPVVRSISEEKTSSLLDDTLRLGWFVRVSGRPLGVEAEIPADNRFEGAYRAVVAVLDGARVAP